MGLLEKFRKSISNMDEGELSDAMQDRRFARRQRKTQAIIKKPRKKANPVDKLTPEQAAAILASLEGDSDES